MKIKTVLLIILLWSITNLLQAEGTITNIELLTGNDYIQLFLKANGIISIPDLFYPSTQNPQLLVMKLKDAKLSLEKDQYVFNSPLIDSVKVLKSEKDAIEIYLKKKANYRVFVNKSGLYVEFLQLAQDQSAAKTNTGPLAPAANKTDLQAKNELTGEIVTQPVSLRDVLVNKKDENQVSVQLMLSGKVEYEVVPVQDKPVRLAIDLKNTKPVRKIQQVVNILNLKVVRGAYHQPSVYRIVFDLEYLKNYHVSQVNNSLSILFSNSDIQNQKQDSNAPIAQNPVLPVIEKKAEMVETKTPVPNEALENKIVLNTHNKDEFFSKPKSKVNETPQEKTEAEKTEDMSATEQFNQESFMKQTINEGRAQWTGEPMSFKFYDMDLKNVLLFIAKFAGLSLVLDPGVSGKITCDMTDIPWDQALDYFLKINGLDMTLEGRLLRIGKIDKLATEADQRLKLKQALELQGDLKTVLLPLSYIETSKITPILKKHLSLRGDILEDARSNTLIVSDLPDKIKVVEDLIKALDTPIPQVYIEAKLVETSSNYSKNLGIQWGYSFIADAAYGNQTSLKFPNNILMDGSQLLSTSSPMLGPLGGYAVNLPAPGATSAGLLSIGNIANTLRLDMALSALETSGKGRVISSPRTLTQNNQEAQIMQGKQIPVQTIQNNTISVQFFNYAMELKVKPQITAEGTVILTIDIQNNDADFTNLVNGIPPIIKQSVKTTVQTEDGGTVVIGGLYKIEDRSTSATTPFFSQIPIIGTLFKSSSRKIEQKEILVFITPRIVK